jgi:hypothetical protein
MLSSLACVSGTCTYATAPLGTVCRPSRGHSARITHSVPRHFIHVCCVGVCDVAERCTGQTCPVDALLKSDQVRVCDVIHSLNDCNDLSALYTIA